MGFSKSKSTFPPALPEIGDPHKPPPAWQLALRRVLNTLWFELAIGLLVMMSVGLTLCELSIETERNYQLGELSAEQNRFLDGMHATNNFITFLFVIELSLRFVAASSKRRFFQEYWLDILATVPLLRPLRTARALRFFRLIRLFRLLGLATRLSLRYPVLFRRGALDIVVICAMLLICVLFGTVVLMHFESQAAYEASERIESDEQFSLQNSIWFSVYTLFAGEPTPMIPQTVVGRLVAVFIMFMGLTMFAVFAGTISAFMVDRIRREGAIVDFDEFFNHIVICGWTAKTEIIIREFRASAGFRNKPIVVIAELDPDSVQIESDIRTNVAFINDDFTRVAALERGGIRRAEACIILADRSGNRSEQDADARTILAALTVEKINPEVLTSAELLHRTYGTHLDLGKVNSYVVSGEYGAYLLAHEAMKRGSMGVIDELLTCQRGNEFYQSPVPDKWIGRSFDELFAEVREKHGAIMVGVQQAGEHVEVNPARHVFGPNERVVMIAEKEVKLD